RRHTRSTRDWSSDVCSSDLFAKIPEAFILAFNAPSIRGLGATGGFSVQIQDPSGGDFKKFSAVAEEFLAKARQDPAIGAIGTNLDRKSTRLNSSHEWISYAV